MQRQTSAKGRKFIEKHEGVVLKAYRDAAGVWTIGVGHTAAAGGLVPKKGMTITAEQADNILSADLAKFEKRVNDRMPDQRPTVFDGGVSFDFNTGAIDRASWVGAFLVGDRSAARARLMQWVNAGGKKLAGLVNRRTAEAKLIFEGNYGDGLPGFTFDVLDVQEKLKYLGYNITLIDGKFGIETEANVQRFQADNDLTIDGIVGPATLTTLNRRVAEKKAVNAAVGGSASTGAAAGTTEIATRAPEIVTPAPPPIEQIVTPDTFAWAGGAAAVVLLVILGGFLLWHFRGPILLKLKGK